MENHAVENGAESRAGQIVKLIDQNQKFKLHNSKLMHLMVTQAGSRNQIQKFWIFPLETEKNFEKLSKKKKLKRILFLVWLILYESFFLRNSEFLWESGELFRENGEFFR